MTRRPQDGLVHPLPPAYSPGFVPNTWKAQPPLEVKVDESTERMKKLHEEVGRFQESVGSLAENAPPERVNLPDTSISFFSDRLNGTSARLTLFTKGRALPNANSKEIAIHRRGGAESAFI